MRCEDDGEGATGANTAPREKKASSFFLLLHRSNQSGRWWQGGGVTGHLQEDNAAQPATTFNPVHVFIHTYWCPLQEKTHTHTHTKRVSGEVRVDLCQKFAAEETAPSEDGAGNAPQACFQSPSGERAHLCPQAAPGLVCSTLM